MKNGNSGNVGAVGVAAVVSPALAEARGIGPDVAFGLAAGAIAAGVFSATNPYYTVLTATTLTMVAPLLRARPVLRRWSGPLSPVPPLALLVTDATSQAKARSTLRLF